MTSLLLIVALAVSAQTYDAAQYAGSDCGARINTADAALGAAPGEILVTAACGTAWSTSVAVNPQHVLRIGPGTYTTSASITLGTTTALLGACRGNIAVSGCTVIREANGANLAAMVSVPGHGVRMQDIFIDGNKEGNPSALDAVYWAGVKAQIYNVGIENAKRHGLVLGGATAETKISQSSIAASAANGLEILSGATDLFVDHLVSVNNFGMQVHGSGSIGGLHFIGGDYSGLGASSGDCIFLDGSGGGVNFFQFSTGTMLNCGGAGIRVVNGNMGAITGMIIGNIGMASPGVSDAIQLTNWGPFAISGNSIADGGTMRRCVNIVASTQPSAISGNTCLTAGAGTGLIQGTAGDAVNGNVSKNSRGIVP